MYKERTYWVNTVDSNLKPRERSICADEDDFLNSHNGYSCNWYLEYFLSFLIVLGHARASINQ